MGKGGADAMAIGAIAASCCICTCFCIALSSPIWIYVSNKGNTDLYVNLGLWGTIAGGSAAKAADQTDYQTYACDEICFLGQCLAANDRAETTCTNSRGLMVATFVFTFIAFVCNIAGMAVKMAHLGAAAFHFLAGVLGIAVASYYVNRTDVEDTISAKRGYGGGVYLCFIGAILSFVACGLSAVIGMGMMGGGDDAAPSEGVEAPPEAVTAKV